MTCEGEQAQYQAGHMVEVLTHPRAKPFEALIVSTESRDGTIWYTVQPEGKTGTEKIREHQIARWLRGKD